jgi:hypothetical protein
MKLWRVSLKVVPTKDHPMFFEVQFAVLHAWLFADSPEQAGERVAAIAEHLPYAYYHPAGELPGTWQATMRPAGPGDPPEFVPHEKEAREIGFAMCVDYCATGMDEDLFADLEPR